MNTEVTRPSSFSLLDHVGVRCDVVVKIHNSTIVNETSDHNIIISHALFPIVMSKYVSITKPSTD